MTCEHSLKTWSDFWMFSFRKVIKVMEWKKVLVWNTKYRNYVIFYGSQKALVKTRNKECHCFLLKLVLSKASKKQMTKAALALVLSKSIFVRMIFRMDTLHTQANHEIWHNFLFSHLIWIYRRASYKFVLLI